MADLQASKNTYVDSSQEGLKGTLEQNDLDFHCPIIICQISLNGIALLPS